jgi:hypothetical protein
VRESRESAIDPRVTSGRYLQMTCLHDCFLAHTAALLQTSTELSLSTPCSSTFGFQALAHPGTYHVENSASARKLKQCFHASFHAWRSKVRGTRAARKSVALLASMPKFIYGSGAYCKASGLLLILAAAAGRATDFLAARVP